MPAGPEIIARPAVRLSAPWPPTPQVRPRASRLMVTLRDVREVRWPGGGHMWLPGRITSAFLSAACAIAVAACTAPAASAPPPTPSSVPAWSHIGLTSVSCTSARSCVAVGAAAVSQARMLPVAEIWNGHRWLGQRVPGPAGTTRLARQLTGVSCSGPSRCVAVGHTTTATGDVSFADSWNGTRWRLLPLSYPTGSTELTGVSCRASMCVLTGFYLTGGQLLPLTFELDGTAQRRLTPAIPRGQGGATLVGVWCATPSACMTVGHYEPAQGQGTANLAEEWDGSRWHVLKRLALRAPQTGRDSSQSPVPPPRCASPSVPTMTSRVLGDRSRSVRYGSTTSGGCCARPGQGRRGSRPPPLPANPARTAWRSAAAPASPLLADSRARSSGLAARSDTCPSRTHRPVR